MAKRKVIVDNDGWYRDSNIAAREIYGTMAQDPKLQMHRVMQLAALLVVKLKDKKLLNGDDIQEFIDAMSS